jgi:hypothetical protein
MSDILRLRGKSEHDWVGDSLSAYIDGELSPRDNARVEQHLRECQTCAENVATLQQTVGLLRDLPRLPVPRSFALRPAQVQPKARVAAPQWGYGLLKGATALAALLLVLLIGADVSLQALGGFRFVGAPAAPAPAFEAAMPPSATPPSASPVEAEDQLMANQSKEAETPAVLPQETLVPEPTAEGPEACLTPCPEGTPVCTVGTAEEEAARASAEVTAPTEMPAPAPPALGAGGAELTATPAPAPAATVETREGTLAQPSPSPTATATPQIVGMAEEHALPILGEDAGVRGRLYPLSPLRLAEFAVIGILLILIPSTIATGWVIRKRR